SENNETAALQALERHRSLMRPLFKQFGGREIKTMADGFLIEFASAVEAVRASLEIQKTLKSESEQIRIGIHLGDIVAQGDDVLGDGVNIASRIEKLAEPGGVCITEDVARQVRNKLDAQFVSLGKPTLKNIQTPIEVFKIVLDGSVVARREQF